MHESIADSRDAIIGVADPEGAAGHVEGGETAGMLGQQQRFEAAFAVARRLDQHFAVPGQHRLGRAAVAMIGQRLGFVRPRCVAEVMAQFGADYFWR